METIEVLVFTQHLTVTPHLVSKALQVHVSEATNLLNEFVAKFSKLNLKVKYLSVEDEGNEDGSLLKLKRFLILDQDDPKRLNSNCQVYSVKLAEEPNKSESDIDPSDGGNNKLFNFDNFFLEPSQSNIVKLQRLTFIDNQHIKLRQTRRNGVKLNIEYDYLDGDELEKFVLEPELKPPVFIEPEVKPPVVNSPKKKVEPEAKPVIQNSLKKVKREISDEENDTKSRKTYKRIRIEDDEDEEEDEVASKANANETKENEFQETEFKITKMEDVPEENVKPIKNEKPAPKEIPKQKPKPKVAAGGMKSIASYFNKQPKIEQL